jgi:ABC-2 type transport system permease protein
MTMEAVSAAGESRLFVFVYLFRLLRVLAMLAVWRTVAAGRAGSSLPAISMSLPQILTYTLVAEVFADLLTCRTGLDMAWFDGSITTRFLRPMSLFHQFSAEMLGRAAMGGLFFSIPLLLGAALVGVDPRPANLTAGLLAGISLAAAVGVGLALEYLFAGLGIAAKIHPYTISNVRTAVSAVVSGAVIPLAILPWNLGSGLAWLPFASQASAPLRIYTATGRALPLIALQCLWIVLLWPLASWIWRANRERMVSFGG